MDRFERDSRDYQMDYSRWLDEVESPELEEPVQVKEQPKPLPSSKRIMINKLILLVIIIFSTTGLYICEKLDQKEGANQIYQEYNDLANINTIFDNPNTLKCNIDIFDTPYEDYKLLVYSVTNNSEQYINSLLVTFYVDGEINDVDVSLRPHTNYNFYYRLVDTTDTDIYQNMEFKTRFSADKKNQSISNQPKEDQIYDGDVVIKVDNAEPNRIYFTMVNNSAYKVDVKSSAFMLISSDKQNPNIKLVESAKDVYEDVSHVAEYVSLDPGEQKRLFVEGKFDITVYQYQVFNHLVLKYTPKTEYEKLNEQIQENLDKLPAPDAE